MQEHQRFRHPEQRLAGCALAEDAKETYPCPAPFDLSQHPESIVYSDSIETDPLGFSGSNSGSGSGFLPASALSAPPRARP
ncbi:UNVERIFIED_CONTAM: hypothetical protein K2H54_012832 [Gekko kuhli]